MMDVPEHVGASQAGVRLAHAADIPLLVGMLARLFAIETDLPFAADRAAAGFEALIAAPQRSCVAVAERSGAVVGMASAQLLVSTAMGGTVASIEDVFVDETERGSGVGRALLGALETWARQRGARRLQLLADSRNAPALAFYDVMGLRATHMVWRVRLLDPQ